MATPDPVLCPVCYTSAIPAAVVGGITICGSCGASLIDEGSHVRRALAVEVQTLDAADLVTLRRARGAITRPDRKAR